MPAIVTNLIAVGSVIALGALFVSGKLDQLGDRGWKIVLAIVVVGAGALSLTNLS